MTKSTTTTTVAPVVTITVGLTPAQLAAGFAVGAKVVGLADLIGIDHTSRAAAMFAESRLFLTLAVLAPIIRAALGITGF